MGSIAERVYTDPLDISRLESRIETLPDEAMVDLLLADGSSITGIVVTRPTIQAFRDAKGCEGLNSLVRIDELHTGMSQYIWLDRISQVTALGSA